MGLYHHTELGKTDSLRQHTKENTGIRWDGQYLLRLHSHTRGSREDPLLKASLMLCCRSCLIVVRLTLANGGKPVALDDHTRTSREVLSSAKISSHFGRDAFQHYACIEKGCAELATARCNSLLSGLYLGQFIDTTTILDFQRHRLNQMAISRQAMCYFRRLAMSLSPCGASDPSSTKPEIHSMLAKTTTEHSPCSTSASRHGALFILILRLNSLHRGSEHR